MVKRLYIDTSVFGGYYDAEFEFYTKLFFNRISSEGLIVLFSGITQDELEGAPLKVKEVVKKIRIEQTEFLDVTEEAVNLGSIYIEEKVVGETSFADCLHIALATINSADYLISWNFKHIVNVERIKGYNCINTKHGYRRLEICSPENFLKNEYN